MAKDTQFSNNPQPDDPHAAAKRPAEGEQHPKAPEEQHPAGPEGTMHPAGEATQQVNLGEHAADAGDSAVNLGADLAGGSGSGQQMDMSGVSAIEWAALVEDESGASGGPGAKSDASRARGPEPEPRTAKDTLEAIDLFAEEEAAGGAAGQPAAAGHPGQGPEAADLDVLDTLVAGEAAGPSGPSSGPGSGSAVDYGANPPTSADASSGVDLFAPGEVESSLFGSDVSGPVKEGTPSESGINLMAEDVILEESADVGATPAAGEGGSARDLIAEAVESGVDLGAAPRPAGEGAPSGMGEGSDVVSLEGPPGTGAESSAVDLGAVVSGVGREAPPGSGVNLGADVPAPSRPGSVHEHPSASTVDLGSDLPPGLAPGSGSGMASAAAASDSGLNFDVPVQAGGGPAVRSDSGIDLGTASAAGAAAEEPEAAEELAEEEPAVTAEEADEPRPAAPPRPAARGPAWVGGGLLGATAGVVGCVALWLFGVQPPESWRLAGGNKGAGSASAPVQPRPGPAPGPVAAAPPVSFEDAAEHLRNGDFTRAAVAIEQADEAKPEQLAKRGELRWLSYLQKQREANAPIKPDDAPVKQARDDLTKANTPDALFWLGYIHEVTGQTQQAKDTYTKAAQRFQNDPAHRRIFDAALERLEEEGPAGAGAALPRRGGDLLALLLIGLQQPDPVPPVPPGAPAAGQAGAAGDEAGFEFWQAVKLARELKYGEAVKELDKARALHERRRFARLRRAQNPLSDPTEEIFLRCCAELKRYWEMEDRLRQGGFLTAANRRDPVKALDGVLAAAKEGGTGGNALRSAAAKLVQAKVIEKPEELGKGIDRLLAERQAAETKAADLEARVKATQQEAAALAEKAKAAEATALKTEADLKKADADLKAARQRESDVRASAAAAEAALKKAADELVAAKYLSADEAKDPRAALSKGLATVIRMAHAADPSGALRKQEQTIGELRAEVARREAATKERLSPEEMLALWLPLLQQDRGSKELAAKAARDAERVEADPKATAATRAKAEVIRGLALRNGEKFAEARAALQKARASLGSDAGEWRAQADAALKELANPAARYLQEADTLERQGKWAQALAALDRAAAGSPALRGRLRARRALVQLEAAKAKAEGPLQPNDPLVRAARRDAEQAAGQGEAEGSFVAGRIAEELGQWGLAAQKYREAVKAHPALDADGGRYRMALARALLQGTQAEAPAAPPPAPRPARERPGRAAQAPRPLGVLAVMVSLGLQPPPELPPVVPPAAREAERLADEVLAAPEGSVPFDVRAQALAIKGLYTRALTTYVEGLRPLLPPRYADGLLRIVRSHPGLMSRPDSRLVPDPLAAEKHYAAGLNFFFARNYASAEREALAAIENDGQDARFYYYLGLARLLQNKRGAAEDFDQGARLEARGRPAPSAVSAALERVHGPARRRVNEARTRPAEVGR